MFLSKKCFIIMKMVISRRMASSLPCLPVPSLNETLRKLLLSAKPFLTGEEYLCSNNDMERFLCPGGEGEYLQIMLEERAHQRDNWLSDWWEESILEKRTSLVTSSLSGVTFPIQQFECTEEMIIYAAKLVAAVLHFKSLVDENRITRESLGSDLLDRRPYKSIFGRTRVPNSLKDNIVFKPDSDHFIVLFQNSVYKMRAKNKDGWLKGNAIREQLEYIVRNDCVQHPAGFLTAHCRETWNQLYNNLKTNRTNCNILKEIEEALFILCLDTECPTFEKNRIKTSLELCFYGGSNPMCGGNRWFDKSLQFIVGLNGVNGVCFESSSTEADIITMIMEHVSNRMNEPLGNIPCCEGPEQLYFELDDFHLQCISTAQSYLSNIICDLEIACLKFCGLGKNYLTSFEISPDSFIQIAIQLAFYQICGTIAPQFEVTTTRKFYGGRSEEVRSLTEDIARFISAFYNPAIPIKSKMLALQEALQSHIQLVKQAVNGHGIDRHLFGLSMIACENNRPEPFILHSPFYTYSSCKTICTYQMKAKFDGFMISAPQILDGYACFYNICPEHVNFSISAYCSSTRTNASRLAQNLNHVLIELRDMIQTSDS